MVLHDLNVFFGGIISCGSASLKLCVCRVLPLGAIALSQIHSAAYKELL